MDSKLFNYALFFVFGVISMVLVGLGLSVLSLNSMKIDDIILMAVFEGLFVSFALLATNRVISGEFFTEKVPLGGFLVFGLGYGLSETYFYLRGSVDFLDVLIQRFFIVTWNGIPIPGTLFIVLLCCGILALSNKNKILYVMTGIPVVVIILFIYSALIA